jgi:hypothetical protein
MRKWENEFYFVVALQRTKKNPYQYETVDAFWIKQEVIANWLLIIYERKVVTKIEENLLKYSNLLGSEGIWEDLEQCKLYERRSEKKFVYFTVFFFFLII